MIGDGGVFGHACRVSHDRFCQIYVLLDINPSELYDFYGFYSNLVTLKIKVLCSRTSLPLDTRSSKYTKIATLNIMSLFC